MVKHSSNENTMALSEVIISRKKKKNRYGSIPFVHRYGYFGVAQFVVSIAVAVDTMIIFGIAHFSPPQSIVTIRSTTDRTMLYAGFILFINASGN